VSTEKKFAATPLVEGKIFTNVNKVWLVLSCALRVFPRYLGFLPQQKVTLRPIVVKHVYHEPQARMKWAITRGTT
jgi:branched-subunit amino acid transport protein